MPGHGLCREGVSDSVCAPVAQGQIDAACSFLAAFKDKVPQDCLEYAACRFVEAYVEESVSDGSDVERHGCALIPFLICWE